VTNFRYKIGQAVIHNTYRDVVKTQSMDNIGKCHYRLQRGMNWVSEADLKPVPAKYGNKICYLDKERLEPYNSIPDGEHSYDYERFDSALERAIYLSLISWIGLKNNHYSSSGKPFKLIIERQERIPLISKEHNIARVQVDHIVDFMVTLLLTSTPRNQLAINQTRKLQEYYIEAKGIVTAECSLKWKILEARYAYFHSGHYLVVGNTNKARCSIAKYPILEITPTLVKLAKSVLYYTDAWESVNGNLH